MKEIYDFRGCKDKCGIPGFSARSRVVERRSGTTTRASDTNISVNHREPR